MRDRRPVLPETILSEPAAAQLLARASELDAALKGGTSIATLRAAATEAGISSTAFEAAVLEAQAEHQVQALTVTPRRQKTWSWLAGAALLLLGLATIGVVRSTGVQRSTPPAGMIERPLLVRCLPMQDAAELIRPYLDQSSTVLIPKGSRVLRIRATPAQLDKIGSALEQAERTSTTCVSR
jgi:hypothetical protein